MEKFLIVDGHNLLFQMFFGMPSRIHNKEGKAIQGTLGFVGALLKIIKMVNPNYLVVLFDGEHKNERNNIDKTYKANRVDYLNVEAEKNPFSQLADILKALEFLNIKYKEIDRDEADDVIASYVHKYSNNLEIVISSNDSDFFQLINDRVSVLCYRGKKTTLYDVKYIEMKYNIRPEQFAEYKAFIGDKSDNIKGISRIGPKTAAKLLKEYGSILEIINNSAKIDKPSIRNIIDNEYEKLLKNYNLINLKRNVTVPFQIFELKYVPITFTTKEILNQIGLM